MIWVRRLEIHYATPPEIGGDPRRGEVRAGMSRGGTGIHDDVADGSGTEIETHPQRIVDYVRRKNVAESGQDHKYECREKVPLIDNKSLFCASALPKVIFEPRIW